MEHEDTVIILVHCSSDFNMHSRFSLSNIVVISYMWLFKFKLIKINKMKISVHPSHYLPFRYSVATSG